MADKQIYRVRPGYRFGIANEYKAGDEVELTEAEASGFLDKLELVSAPAPTPPPPAPDPESPPKAAARGRRGKTGE